MTKPAPWLVEKNVISFKHSSIQRTQFIRIRFMPWPPGFDSRVSPSLHHHLTAPKEHIFEISVWFGTRDGFLLLVSYISYGFLSKREIFQKVMLTIWKVLHVLQFYWYCHARTILFEAKKHHSNYNSRERLCKRQFYLRTSTNQENLHKNQCKKVIFIFAGVVIGLEAEKLFSDSSGLGMFVAFSKIRFSFCPKYLGSYFLELGKRFNRGKKWGYFVFSSKDQATRTDSKNRRILINCQNFFGKGIKNVDNQYSYTDLKII